MKSNIISASIVSIIAIGSQGEATMNIQRMASAYFKPNQTVVCYTLKSENNNGKVLVLLLAQYTTGNKKIREYFSIDVKEHKLLPYNIEDETEFKIGKEVWVTIFTGEGGTNFKVEKTFMLPENSKFGALPAVK